MIADILTHTMTEVSLPFSALNGVLRSSKQFSCWPIDRALYVVETAVDEPQRYTMRAYPNGYRISARIDKPTGVLIANYVDNALATVSHPASNTLVHFKLGIWVSLCFDAYDIWTTHDNVRDTVTVDIATGFCQHSTLSLASSTATPDAPIAQTILGLLRTCNIDAACAAMADRFGADSAVRKYVADSLCEALL